MNASGPVFLAAGLLLIGLGLVWPMLALIRINRRLSENGLSGGPLIVMLALNGLLPLTAVLAGFYLLAPRARESLFFLGVLLTSALLLLVALVLQWTIRRSR
jgi:hypothetical protein